MLTQERYQVILQRLQEKRAVTVIELTRALGASEATVRRDLNALHEQGLLVKVHGGATAASGAFVAAEPDVPTKSTLHVPEKEAIGAYGAALIEDDDFVYLDAGTSVDKLIEHIKPTRAGFVTNGISHAAKLTQKGLKTFLLGGQFKSTTQAIVGGMALQNLRQYNFTKCFLGVNGISLEAGLTTPDAEEAMLKTEAVGRSLLSFVLADSSKFGLISSLTFAPLSKVCVLTNAAPDRRYLEAAQIRVVGS